MMVSWPSFSSVTSVDSAAAELELEADELLELEPPEQPARPSDAARTPQAANAASFLNFISPLSLRVAKFERAELRVPFCK